jgi:hypothetical protein
MEKTANQRHRLTSEMPFIENRTSPKPNFKINDVAEYIDKELTETELYASLDPLAPEVVMAKNSSDQIFITLFNTITKNPLTNYYKVRQIHSSLHRKNRGTNQSFGLSMMIEFVHEFIHNRH